MQVKIKDKKKKEFQPFTMEITIESYGELYELWHRTNISIKSVLEIVNRTNTSIPYYGNDDVEDFWKELNKKIKELN